METKSRKSPNYAKIAKLVEKSLEKYSDKQLIDKTKLQKFQKDEKRIRAIKIDVILDSALKNLFCELHFSKKDKQVKKLFEPNIGGPLVSLTHKARLAYALGLIDKTLLNDVEFIHKIRNEFAHSIEADFTDTKVLEHVKKLSMSEGQDVTATNSYTFYLQTLNLSIESLGKAIDQAVNRRAAQKGIAELYKSVKVS